MKKGWKFFSLVVVLFSTSLVLIFSSSSADTSEIFEHPSVLQESPKALVCPFGEKCSIEVIEKKPVSCTPYHPRGGKDANCSYTDKGIENVSLITDENNYVQGEFSDKDFNVDYIHHQNSGPYDKIGYSDLEFLENGSHMMVTSLHFLTYYNAKHEKLSSTRLGNYVDKESSRSNWSVLVKGFALDPEYEENKQIYVYYYLRKKGKGWKWSDQVEPDYYKLRVSKFKYQPRSDKVFSNEKRIFDIKGARAHMGGEVEIGPDNRLYISIGDGTEGEKAVNLSSYRGKILRLNRNGSVPNDNPFDNSLTYSYGHRNPQGLAWHPDTNNIYSSEHGPERYDEINLIRSGENYGWPNYKCETPRNSETDRSKTTSPLRCYRNWSMGPSGGTFVDDKDHPWYGSLFVTGLRGNHVRELSFENGKLQNENIFFYSKNPAKNNLTQRFRDIEYFNGSLYVVGDGQGIAKLTPRERSSWVDRIL
jgi:glucose/arabinose dehydrogenase